jgi:hypothetical protein
MSFEVIVTSGFKKHAKRIAKKYPSFKADLGKLITSLKENPLQGKALGRDCYKIRMTITSKGQGKSGGSRVITYVQIIDQEAFLLTVYDKSVKNTISDKELDELIKLAGIK